MATMIPDIDPDSIDNDGERDVYAALRKQLPNDWIVRHGYALCDLRGGRLEECEADFIVLAPEKGILFLEVKGNHGWECEGGQWFQIDKSLQKTPRRSPFDQATRTKHLITDKLAKKLGFQGKNEFPGAYGHVVVYPRGKVIGQLPQSKDPSIILAHKDMNSLKERLADAYQKWDRERRGGLFTRRHMDSLAQILRDECRFVVLDSLDVKDDERAILELTSQQFDLFRAILANRMVLVRGVAGSGKTMIATWMAETLVAQGKKVLLLCYNKALAAWLKLTRQGAAYDVYYFNELCDELIHKAKVPIPAGTENTPHYWEKLSPALCMTAIDALGDGFEKYDAIFVDEAQDFHADWWIPVELLLKEPKLSSLYIFHDPDQQLYSKPSAYPFEAERTVVDLDVNCRNTRRIAATAGHAISKGIPSFDASPEGVRPELQEVSPDLATRAERVRKLLVGMVEQGYDPSQIAVLSPWRRDNPLCSLPFLPSSIHGKGLFSTQGEVEAERLRNGLEQWRQGQHIWTGTIKSFKGLEAACVILTDLPVFMDLFTVRDLYVAVTRAKHRLHLIPASEKAYAALKKQLEM